MLLLNLIPLIDVTFSTPTPDFVNHCLYRDTDSMRHTASMVRMEDLMWIGSGHCYRSHQLSIHGCKYGYLLAV